MIAYEENPVECQRLASSQGYTTICLQEISDTEQPAFGLYATTSAAGLWLVSADGHLSNPSSHHKLSWVENRSSEEGFLNSRMNQPHEAILVIRGTQSIQDVVTDIRAAPAAFPPPHEEILKTIYGTSSGGGGGGIRSRGADSDSSMHGSDICTPSKIGSSLVSFLSLLYPSLHISFVCRSGNGSQIQIPPPMRVEVS
jgi:hypothetical protein